MPPVLPIMNHDFVTLQLLQYVSIVKQYAKEKLCNV